MYEPIRLDQATEGLSVQLVLSEAEEDTILYAVTPVSHDAPFVSSPPAGIVQLFVGDPCVSVPELKVCPTASRTAVA